MHQEIEERIRAGHPITKVFASGGLLKIDRGLPFLLVYREPPAADAGTDRLVRGEASILIAGRESEAEAADLIRTVASSGSTTYGGFLVLEIWAARDPQSRQFVIKAPDGAAAETVRTLQDALSQVTGIFPDLDVAVDTSGQRHPPDLDAVLSIEESWQTETLLLGLEIPPVYRSSETGEVYPRFLRKLHHRLSMAIRRAVYEFVRVQTSAQAENHLALGTRSVPDATWEIDRLLRSIERRFDPLLLTSPVNFRDAWEQFRRDGFARAPEFHYRLLPIDPDLLKRRLFAIEIERIDDPALAQLFDDKRDELDSLLTMLGDRGTARFRHGSHRLYGTVDDDLSRRAEAVLTAVESPQPWTGEWVDAHQFYETAAAELRSYTSQYPQLDREIQIRRDLSGLMVSEGNLLIGASVRLRPERVAPLLHHEVGTHVLTYVNGSAQPLQLLALGLARYDELQEGLAVFSEYLAGGLDALRMRLLAARVLAARSVEQGAEFVETFRLLRDEYGFSDTGAWDITMRVHASGGYTRDLIYLRGLVRLLRYLRRGGELEPLYIGKIAQKHVPIVEELRYRRVLRKPPLQPRVLELPGARERLRAARNGLTLTEMICSPTE